MSSRNELQYWSLTCGGSDGGKHLDGADSVTGQQAQMIDVINPCVFTVLTGHDSNTGTSVNFLTANGLTGITRGEGFVWPGHGRYFSAITISTGQLAYYTRKDS